MIRAGMCLVAIGGVAHASGFTDGDQVLHDQVSDEASDTDSAWPRLQLDGAIRFRAGYLYNFDLDRGLTPSGDPLFPVTDPNAQTTPVRDMRIRTDLVARSRSGTMNVKLRLDILDDTGLGASSITNASGRTTDSGELVHLRRAYTEILTPLGVLVAGRMGNQFGLGMVANGGDCLDCNGGDAADRIGLVMPVRGFLVATAADLSSTGQLQGSRDAGLDIDPRNNAHAVTTAVMRWRSDSIRAIRRRDGRTNTDYAATLSYIWQERDTPATYLLDDPGSNPASMERGLRGLVTAGWFRFERPTLRVEVEGAIAAASIDQASPIPGALFREPVHLLQTGLVIESEAGAPEARFGAGLDGGYASGDPSPGFGAFPSLGNADAKQGDLDGSQARPPMDNRIDNFRFSPNYRIDKILFRQIIGTVTDAIYVRPHARARIADLGPGTVTANLAVIASWAVEPTSTPSGARSLGLELDTNVAYRTRDGFVATLSHAVLLPGAAFDNPTMGTKARVAQAVDLLMGYVF